MMDRCCFITLNFDRGDLSSLHLSMLICSHDFRLTNGTRSSAAIRSPFIPFLLGHPTSEKTAHNYHKGDQHVGHENGIECKVVDRWVAVAITIVRISAVVVIRAKYPDMAYFLKECKK